MTAPLTAKHSYEIECQHCGQRFLDRAKLLFHPCTAHATSPRGSEKKYRAHRVRAPLYGAWVPSISRGAPGYPNVDGRSMHRGTVPMTCGNLHERFGRRYRIGWEADGATRYQWPETERPWLMEIRCRYGVVYPYGGDILAAVGRGSRIGTKLRALPCMVRSARGDLETVVTFHVNDAPTVFAVLRPYRRRQVSEAERERLARLSHCHGFGAERISGTHQAEPESTIGNDKNHEHGGGRAGTPAA